MSPAKTFTFDISKPLTEDQIREANEFLEAKRIKREPVVLSARATGTASWSPKDSGSFHSLLLALRKNNDFTNAVEHLYSLARALRMRSGYKLPVPRQVEQNQDKSISVFWGPEGRGITLMTRKEGIFSIIGGVQGIAYKGEATGLLDALALEYQFQESQK